MPDIEILVFLTAAIVIGALTMGGVTLVYFLDQRRVDPVAPSSAHSRDDCEMSAFDRAA